MFKDATFESMGTIHTQSRNWMIATFGLNASILAALITIPLMHPSALPQLEYPHLLEPPAPVEEPKPVKHQASAPAQATDIFEGRPLAPPTIPPHIWFPTTPEPRGIPNAGDFAGGPAALPRIGCGPLNCSDVHPVVQGPQPVQHISLGVAEGLLINRVLPVYPAPARVMRIFGNVQLEATISRSGTIENLRVMSGPAFLTQAAIDAVKQWRYRPYLMNGEPVEVETTINVEFKLD